MVYCCYLLFYVCCLLILFLCLVELMLVCLLWLLLCTDGGCGLLGWLLFVSFNFDFGWFYGGLFDLGLLVVLIVIAVLLFIA